MIREAIENKLTSYSPKKVEIGIGGFTLGVIQEESIEMGATAPTSYVESGDYVNDHIINNPLVLSFTGEAGDVHLKESAKFQSYRRTAGTIGRMTPYFPKRTATQISKIAGILVSVGDTIDKIDGYVNDGLSAYNFLIGNSPGKTKTPQELFVEFFTMVWENRLYINVEAFGRVYENMVMESLSIKRTDGSFISYAFKFKQLRFATTTAVKVKKKKGLKSGKTKGSTKNQMANKSDKGTTNPKDAKDESVLARILF